MSRLNDLIQELCPDGVEFKKLGDVVTFSNGKGHEKHIDENGKYIVVNSKFISTEGKVKKFSNKQLSPIQFRDIVLVMSDLPNGKALAKTFVIEKNDYYTLNQRIGALTIVDKDVINYKFLSLIVNRNRQLLKHDNKVDQTNLRKDDILKIKIPIPPLKVQDEIVRIFDTFAEYTTELTAEIANRKKQFEYYMHVLLKNKSYNKYKLGDVGKVCMCKRILKSQTNVKEEIPFYKIGTFGGEANSYISNDIYQVYKKKYPYPKVGDILISASGTIGRKVEFDGKPSYFQDSNIVWIDNDESIVLNRYLFHYFTIIKWNVSNGGTITRLYNDNIMKTEIYVPSIETQKKIITILDKFEELIVDTKMGLPTELKNRKKQFEYYMNKILNFQELK